jgi:iron complex outermembrane recepter protein
MNERKKLAVAITVALTASALTQAQPTTTENPAQKVERIEVTGSSIRRVDTEGPAPVITITREMIEKSGQSTVSDILRSQTVNSGGAFDDKFTNSFAPGTSGVSLRGLGQNTTLVLINGRRVANYAFAQNLSDAFVDLNSIPLAAIERIEILKDGASAIYGSDAIAGVINVILRRDFKGAEVTTYYGQAVPYGDAKELRTSLAAGYGDIAKDRFNALMTLDYFKREPKFLRDREYSKSADHTSRGGIDFRSPTGSPGTWIFNQGQPTGTSTFSKPFPTCKPTDIIPDFYAFSGLGDDACGYNFNNAIADIIKTDRVGATARVSYALTPSITAFFDGSYNKNESQTLAAATPAAFNLPVGHNSNPFDTPVRISYRFLDVGPRTNDITSENSRAVLGVKGTNFSWDWEAAISATRNTTENVGTNYIDAQAIAQLVSSGVYDFLNPSRNSPSQVQALRIVSGRLGVSDAQSVDVKGSRELMELPGGPLAVAVGAEYRREHTSDTPDKFTREGRVVGSGGTSSSGSRSADALYAELSAPVLKNLELQAAVRRDSYSDFGSATVPKFGFKYSPTKQFAVRGSYGEGFRAPSLPELYLGNSISFSQFVDTPRCNAYTAAQRAGNATAAEATSVCRAAQYRTSLAGNNLLKAETSKSIFVGMIIEPTKDLSISLDYFDIDHADKIANPSISYQLLNPSAFPGTVFREQASARDAAVGAPGRLQGSGASDAIGLLRSYYNLGKQRAQGVDVEARYRVDIAGVGRVSTQAAATYYDKLFITAAPGLAPQQQAGTYQYPRVVANASLGLARGAWDTTLSANYTHHYQQFNQISTSHVGQNLTWNLVATYTGIKNIRLTVGARNLLDRDPPFSDNETEGYDFGTHDSRGRFVFGSFTYTFK